MITREIESLDSDSDDNASDSRNRRQQEQRRNSMSSSPSQIVASAIEALANDEDSGSPRSSTVHNIRHRLFHSGRESFLENMARQEKDMCGRSFVDRDGRSDQLHRMFYKLNSGKDAKLSGGVEYTSSSSSGSDDDDDDDDDESEYEGDLDLGEDENDDVEGGVNDQNNDMIGDDPAMNEHESGQQIRHPGEDIQRSNIVSALQLLPSPSHITFNSSSQEIRGTNNIQRISSLLQSLANSEENPLIRADIPWPVIIACGTPFMNPSIPQYAFLESSPLSQPKPSLLQTLYHQLDDPNGTRLLQGVLRSKPNLIGVSIHHFISLTNIIIIFLVNIKNSGLLFTNDVLNE